jgi:LysM repeat protein
MYSGCSDETLPEKRVTLEELEVLEIVWKDDPVIRKKPSNVPQIYTVQKGDTLFHIARRFGLTITEIKRMNGLDTDIIHPGMKLKLKR